MRFLKSSFLQIKKLLPLLAVVLLYENCEIHKPQVDNASFASVGFGHSGRETSCASCHEASRPTSTDGFIGIKANSPFDYSDHGLGVDCISCHNPSKLGARKKSDWSGATYAHPKTLTSCASCHETQRFIGTIQGFDHTTGVAQAGDCFSCHAQSLNSPMASMSNWAGAATTPVGLVWDPNQDLTLDTQIPTYSQTFIQSLMDQSVRLHLGMNHKTSQLSGAQLQNCTSCHSGSGQGIYTGGVFHASLTLSGIGQPATCTECHSISNPKGFVGPAGVGRSPASSEMKHNAVLWTKSGSTYSQTTTPVVSNDCTVCHKVVTDWSGAQYHASLTGAAIAQPSQCLDCHANSRAIGSVPTGAAAGVTTYDHINSGMGDCVSCHTSQTIWSGGKFHGSAGAQTSCLACHSSQRPTTAIGFTAYDATNLPFHLATHGDSLDCAVCHQATTQFNVKADWKGGKYVHPATMSSCVNCHLSQRPAVPVTGNGFTNFDHSISGTGDCIGCHQASVTNKTYSNMNGWFGGAGGLPAGLVGSAKIAGLTTFHLNSSSGKVISYSTTTQTLPLQMLHSSSQIPASFIGNANCIKCHASYPTLAPGVFHTPIANAGVTLTSCTDCHNGSVPVDIVGGVLKAMDHTASLTADCVSCHTTPGGVGGFANSAFHQKIAGKVPSTCTVCHYPAVAAVPTVKNEMNHTSSFAPQDCVKCHSLPTAAQSSSALLTAWAGGAFHSKVSTQPNACVDCHSSQKPASITVSSNDTQHMNHALSAVSTECAACHLSDAGKTAWSKTILFHSSVAATTCQECHGLGNGSAVAGTGNDLPAGLTNSTYKTSSSVAAANTYDQVTHTEGTVAGKDCKVCHTQVGMTGTKWKAASYHKNVGTPGNCATCHNNIKPSAGKTTQDHTSITQDCSGCHSYPGTGTAAVPNWLGASSGGPHTYAFLSGAAMTCVSCHTLSGQATAPVGAPLQINLNNSGAPAAGTTGISFAHSFPATSGGTKANDFNTCLGCHTAAATNALGAGHDGTGISNINGWKPTGTFNHLIPSAVTYSNTGVATVTASSTVNSCLPCHANRGASSGRSGHNIYQVGGCAAGKAPQDCMACHKRTNDFGSHSDGVPKCM